MRGYRVITYDRRGFGASSKPVSGYNYDTLAEDLHKLITKLDLRDIALVGFSMGGGEVARYLGVHGSERVSSAVFISAITPFLLRTPDNPEGVDSSVFEEIKQAIVADRPAFLSKFSLGFLQCGHPRQQAGQRRSRPAQLEHRRRSLTPGYARLRFSMVDRLPKAISSASTYPTLVIHGDHDRIVPFPSSGKRMPEFVKGSKLVVVEGGPHGVNWTHAEKVNQELLAFLGQAVRRKAAA